MRVSGEPALDNLGNLARLAKFVDLAAQYNLLVMLDMHRLNANGGIDEVRPSFVACFDLSEYGIKLFRFLRLSRVFYQRDFS